MSVRIRVVVDDDLCEANGTCVKRAPGLFELDEDDRLKLLVVYPPADRIDDARAAVRSCPKGALSIIEEPIGD